MSASEKGVVAAGHPLTAEAGAQVLRDGGNAVDAAVAAMLTSFAAEPLLTGLGAGGYMLVAGGGQEPALLDFFVRGAPRARDGSAAELEAVDVSFGDAVQVFYIGPASCGVYGAPAGVCEAVARWGTMPLAELAAPAAQLAREGVVLNAGQAYIVEILADLLRSTPECAALWAPEGRVLREGELLRNPELGDALERLGADGRGAVLRGRRRGRGVRWLGERGGSLTQRGARRLPGDRARAAAHALSRPRGAHQPAAVGGGHAARLLARSARRAALRHRRSRWWSPRWKRPRRSARRVRQGLSEEGFLARFLVFAGLALRPTSRCSTSTGGAC